MELKLILIIILAVVSTVYLMSLFLKYSLFQAILKGCLVPLILAIYIFSVEKIYWPIVIALVFGWVGDIFLVKISNIRFFRIGLVCFLIGHICYIAAFYKYALPINVIILICSIVAAAILGILIFKFIRANKEMKIPVIAYEVIIMVMAIFALQVFLSYRNSFGALVLAGALCFVVSDTSLAFDTFRKHTKLGAFIVMFTYIAAQFLITLGFSLL